MIKEFSDIYALLAGSKPRRAAVAAANDEDILAAVKEASERNIIIPILLGSRKKIEAVLEKLSYDFHGEIIDIEGDNETAEKAVQIISSGKADILVKGFLASSILMKAVLHKEWGLRSGHLLSHIGYIQPQNLKKIIMITDSGMNILPDLNEKKAILENAVEVAHYMGIETPKVAVLSTVETVNPAIQSTMDAAILTMMNKRGQIKGCLVDGPLAMDNAINKEAARHKGIESEVAGDPDIILVPNLETGNSVYKALHYYSDAKFAGTIAGASAPIVLTSRSDSAGTKLNSIALSAYISLKKGVKP
ncbi:MAG: phosphate butyryltransferase [Spirochaetes bacterium]|nr:MAG: phosphate butyryltransferase [Spirochaetota bacterium]